MIKYLILIIVLSGTAMCLYSFSGGVTGTTRKNGTGCTCHGTLTSQDVIVAIEGPDTIVVNDSADFLIRLTGGPLIRGGTNVSLRKGLLKPGEGLRMQNGELTHSAPFTPANNSVTFTFRYIAPSSASIDTVYANGNSVNFDGFSIGDRWNFAPDKKIVIVNTTNILNPNYQPAAFTLFQNYPNPFNPATNILYEIANGDFVTLIVYNHLGQTVETLVNQKQNSGRYEIHWNGSNLSSGTYYYSLVSGNYTKTKKMILTK